MRIHRIPFSAAAVLRHIASAFALLSLGLLLPQSIAFAQPVWRATLFLQPNPTPFISEWRTQPSIGTLTLNNPEHTPQPVVIRFTLARGGKMMLRGQSNPQTANAFPLPTIMNNNAFIGSNNLEYDPEQRDQIMRTGLLPEGDYTACLQIMKPGGALLVNDVCANFTIRLPNAPQLIAPENASTLISNSPTFQWTATQPLPGQTAQYAIRIVEVTPGQNPSQAVTTGTEFFVQRGIPASSFFYPPNAPRFDPALTYAWQVRVTNNANNPFTPNDGKSEVWSFHARKDSTSVAQAKPNRSGVGQVSGTLHYVFGDPKRWKRADQKPLAGMQIRLVTREFYQSGGRNIPIGSPQILAKATTNNDGSFLFNLKDNSSQLDAMNGGDRSVKKTQSIAHVEVLNAYYTSPDEGITIAPGEQTKAGDLVVQVKSYSLSVTVKGRSSNDNIGSGTTVYLLRSEPVAEIPAEEGAAEQGELSTNQHGQKRSNATIVASGITDKNGKVSFNRLVTAYDRKTYRIEVVPDKEHSGYEYEGSSYPKYSENSQDVPPLPNALWQSKRFDLSATPIAIHSSVTGTIRAGFPGNEQPLANRTVKLQVRYFTSKILSSTTPDLVDNGKIVGIAKTNSEGHFTITTTYPGPNLTTLGVKQTYRIVVEDDYMLGPGVNVDLEPGQSRDLGLMLTTPRTYEMHYHADKKDPQTGEKSPAPNTKVYLLRNNTPDGVPADEGLPDPSVPITKFDMPVVAFALTDADGNATFTNLIKHAGGSDSYVVWAESDPVSGDNYQTGLPGIDSWTWNEETDDFTDNYISIVEKRNETLYPLPGRVVGRVVRQDNLTQGIAGANLAWDAYPDCHGGGTTTDEQGNFTVPSSRLSCAFPNWIISKNGYDTRTDIDVTPPADGKQVYLEIPLNPQGVVTGQALYDKGGYWGFYVQLGDGPVVETDGNGYFTSQNPLNSQYTLLNVTPHTPYYLADSFWVHPGGFNAEQNSDIGKFTLYEARHKIRLVVIDQSTGKLIPSSVLVPYLDMGPDGAFNPVSSPNDTSQIEPFFRSESNYLVRLASQTSDVSYELVSQNITNDPSVDWQTYTVVTKPASYISGHVFLQSKKKGTKVPVQYAKVWLDESSSAPQIMTFTRSLAGDNEYSYKLNNVPIGSHTFRAIKSHSGTVGDKKYLKVPTSGLKNIDFTISVYEDMNITELLGFPMDVFSLDSTAKGVVISGVLDSLTPNASFSPSSNDGSASNDGLVFSKLTIIPDSRKDPNGIPYARPSKLPLITDASSFALQYGKIAGVLHPETGKSLTISADPNGLGIIRGEVSITPGQFASVDVVLPDSLYLVQQNSGQSIGLPAITASGSDPVSKSKLAISSHSGKPFHYTLHSFDAIADPAQSSASQPQSLSLATSLVLKLTGSGNNGKATIPIGSVNVTPSGASLGTLDPKDFPTIALDKWSMVISSASFDKKGVELAGSLKAGELDVPFTDLTVTPKSWMPENAKFTLAALSINGVVPLALSAPVSFGYNAATVPPVWQLASMPLKTHSASFNSITGMATSDSIYVKSYYLTSFGAHSFILEPKPVTIYKVATFVPSEISLPDAKTVVVTGSANFSLNGFSFGVSVMSLTKGNGVQMDMSKFLPGLYSDYLSSFKVSIPKNQLVLDDNGLHGTATFSSTGKNPCTLPVILEHPAPGVATFTIDSSIAKFYVDAGKSKYIDSVQGSVTETKSSWTPLHFEGPLKGLTGVHSRMAFTMASPLQTDGPQALSVDNITTPFGSVALTFYPETSRMVGTLQMDNQLPGAGSITGQANMVVDPKGWYFGCNGTLSLNNPAIDITAALLFGGYPDISTEPLATDVFTNASFKKEVPDKMKTLPDNYKALGGFYFCGEATNFLGISLPSIDVDLDPIVHCDVTSYYGAAVSLGMNFAKGNQFDVGGAAFLGVDANAGGSAIVVCCGGSLHAGINLYGIGSLNTSSGDWSLDGGSDLNLSGSLYVGGGLYCTSSCGGACWEHDFNGSMSFGLMHFHAGSDGISLKP